MAATTTKDADLRRLARAVHLDVQGMGPGRYQVTGGARPHSVVKQADGWSCDCADFTFGRRWCKHTLAVRIAVGDRKAINALRLLVRLPKRERNG